MISVEGALTVYEKCLSAASNPTFSALNPACLAIHRNPVNGTATTTTVTYVNAAFAEVSGVDLTADWSTDVWGGDLRRELHDLAAAGREDARHREGARDRLERQPRPGRHHLVEQRRVTTTGPSRRSDTAVTTGTCRCAGAICRARSTPPRPSSTPTSRLAWHRRARRPPRGWVRRARTTCSTCPAVTP